MDKEKASEPAAVLAEMRNLQPRRTFLQSFLRFFSVLWRVLVVLGVILLMIMLPALLAQAGIQVQAHFLDYLVVMLLGALIGFVEIISRYKDAPFQMVITWPGMLYMWVNAFVAAGALWMIRLFGWNFLPADTANAEVARWTQVLAAGLGAMAIFRSSVFVLGKEEDKVSVGPNAVLETLLSAIDKEVDRHRGQERARTVRELVGRMHYEDVSRDLSLISSFLMQNLAADDVQRLTEAQKQVDNVSKDPEVRKYLLGLRIIDVVGEDVLRQAIMIRGTDYYAKQYEALLKSEKPADKPDLPAPSAGKTEGEQGERTGSDQGQASSWQDVVRSSSKGFAAQEETAGGEDAGGVDKDEPDEGSETPDVLG